jgi:hypothetical protein
MQAANQYPTDPRTGAAALYKNDNVEVTPATITIVDTSNLRMTYAVRNVTSVGIRREEANLAIPLLSLGIGIALVVGGLQMRETGAAIAVILAGLGLGAFGVWLMVKSKPDYYLAIVLSSGEKPTIRSSGKTTAEEIESCIRRAMAT